MLLPLVTYALLLVAGVLAMSVWVSRRSRTLLAVTGALQVGLLVSWTWQSDCLSAWCADRAGIATWLAGPMLLALALAYAGAEMRRAVRAETR